jgi:hypothetical protein
MTKSKMRRATRRLLERLAAGDNIESTGFAIVPGLLEARRAGFVASERIGALAVWPQPGRIARRDARRLAWHHTLTDAGRAALAGLARQ